MVADWFDNVLPSPKSQSYLVASYVLYTSESIVKVGVNVAGPDKPDPVNFACLTYELL